MHGGRVTFAPSAPARCPRDEVELDDRLSEPTPGVLQTVAALPGDVLILGAGGKMGPTMARMLRRAADLSSGTRRVIAVSRFSSTPVAETLASHGVEVVRADLSDPARIASLPSAPNVIYMAGQKFGTSSAPGITWMTNTVIPTLVSRRFPASRIVAFSTGNVYPLVPVDSAGSRETDALAPTGEYAWTCVGRERLLRHVSEAQGTPMALIRLNYAVDLRYGVLVDIALRVRTGEPVDVTMGFVNVIWQGDAVAQAIEALRHVAAPPLAVNVTGPERLRVQEIAAAFGRRFGRAPVLTGTESPDALLSNTSLARSLFGAPRVSAERLVDWVADWIGQGGRVLGKSTGFEQREGRF